MSFTTCTSISSNNNSGDDGVSIATVVTLVAVATSILSKNRSIE